MHVFMIYVLVLLAGNVEAQPIRSFSVPLQTPYSSSSQCRDLMEKAMMQWRGQDSNDREMQNRYRTAQQGWQEKVPGTCSAGGPPPICPVDHWVLVSIDKAMDQFHKHYSHLAAQRQGQLYSIRDRCEAKERLRREEEARERDSHGSGEQEQNDDTVSEKERHNSQQKYDGFRAGLSQVEEKVSNVILPSKDTEAESQSAADRDLAAVLKNNETQRQLWDDVYVALSSAARSSRESVSKWLDKARSWLNMRQLDEWDKLALKGFIPGYGAQQAGVKVDEKGRGLAKDLENDVHGVSFEEGKP